MNNAVITTLFFLFIIHTFGNEEISLNSLISSNTLEKEKFSSHSHLILNSDTIIDDAIRVSNSFIEICGIQQQIIKGGNNNQSFLFFVINSTLKLENIIIQKNKLQEFANIRNKGKLYLSSVKISNYFNDKSLFFIEEGMALLRNISFSGTCITQSLVNESSHNCQLFVSDSFFNSHFLESNSCIFWSSHSTIRNCNLINITNTNNIYKSSASHLSCEYSTVESCIFKDCSNVLSGKIIPGINSEVFTSNNVSYLRTLTTYWTQQKLDSATASFENDIFETCDSEDNGGAVCFLGSNSLILNFCDFKKCHSSQGNGGAVAFYPTKSTGCLFINGTNFTSCESFLCGGSIFLINGGASVTGGKCVYSRTGNESYGGCFYFTQYCYNCQINNVFFGNSNGLNGAGLCIESYADNVTIKDCTFLSCYNYKYGSVYIPFISSDYSLYLSTCAFVNNIAHGSPCADFWGDTFSDYFNKSYVVNCYTNLPNNSFYAGDIVDWLIYNEDPQSLSGSEIKESGNPTPDTSFSFVGLIYYLIIIIIIAVIVSFFVSCCVCRRKKLLCFSKKESEYKSQFDIDQYNPSSNQSFDIVSTPLVGYMLPYSCPEPIQEMSSNYSQSTNLPSSNDAGELGYPIYTPAPYYSYDLYKLSINQGQDAQKQQQPQKIQQSLPYIQPQPSLNSSFSSMLDTSSIQKEYSVHPS